MRIYKGMFNYIVTWMEFSGRVRIEKFKTKAQARDYIRDHGGISK